MATNTVKTINDHGSYLVAEVDFSEPVVRVSRPVVTIAVGNRQVGISVEHVQGDDGVVKISLRVIDSETMENPKQYL